MLLSLLKGIIQSLCSTFVSLYLVKKSKKLTLKQVLYKRKECVKLSYQYITVVGQNKLELLSVYSRRDLSHCHF